MRITNWGSPRGDGTYWSVAHFLASTNKAHKAIIGKLREVHKAAMREERERRCENCNDDKHDPAEVAWNFLLCDGHDGRGGMCTKGWRAGCLPTPLAAVPEGDWLCPACTTEAHRKDSERPHEEFESGDGDEIQVFSPSSGHNEGDDPDEDLEDGMNPDDEADLESRTAHIPDADLDLPHGGDLHGGEDDEKTDSALRIFASGDEWDNDSDDDDGASDVGEAGDSR